MAPSGEQELPSGATSRDHWSALTVALSQVETSQVETPLTGRGEYSTPRAGGQPAAVTASKPLPPRRRTSGKPGTHEACDAKRERVVKYVKLNPWIPVRCWTNRRQKPTSRPNRRRAPKSWSRAATSRFPTTTASTSRRSSPASSGSTAPSTSSTSNSTTNATGVSARTVSTSRSPRGAAGRSCRGEGLRRQLLRRARVGGPQAREPAAPQQGPPQGPLRRQDAGVAGRRPPRSCRRRTPNLPAGVRPSAGAGRRRDAISTTTNPGRIVRTKEHPAKPMTVDDALYEMELVGHDFFLFHDKETRPAVRRLPAARLRLRIDPAGLIDRPEPGLDPPDADVRRLRGRVTYDGDASMLKN